MQRSLKRAISMLLVLTMIMLSAGDFTSGSKVYAAEGNSVTIHLIP